MQQILMIDDDAQVASVLAMALETLGHEVVVSSETEQTEKLLTETKPTFVLLDMMMPGRTGIELLKPVRELRPDAVVCMMTGLVDPLLVRTALQAGAWNILYKPYRLTDLQELLATTELFSSALELEKAMLSELQDSEVKLTYTGDESPTAEDLARLVCFADTRQVEADVAHRRLPIVAGELLQNAKLHGTAGDAAKAYSATLKHNGTALVFSVTDNGAPFNWYKAMAHGSPTIGGGAPGLQLVKHLARQAALSEDGKTVTVRL
jgi:DNA-binding response OmpR family regulator